MTKTKPSTTGDQELTGVWKEVQTAIWLVGLAILFWQGWWFPGILILVAISGLTQAALLAYVNRQKAAQTLAEVRERHLPPTCPACGGPLTNTSVRWTGGHTAACPFCGTQVKAVETPDAAA